MITWRFQKQHPEPSTEERAAFDSQIALLDQAIEKNMKEGLRLWGSAENAHRSALSRFESIHRLLKSKRLEDQYGDVMSAEARQAWIRGVDMMKATFEVKQKELLEKGQKMLRDPLRGGDPLSEFAK